MDYLAWEKRKLYLDPSIIVYSTTDIEDERIRDFDEIIWGKILEPVRKKFTKVKVKFDPHHFQEMEESACEKLKALIAVYEKRFMRKEGKRMERILRERQENIDRFNRMIEEMHLKAAGK